MWLPGRDSTGRCVLPSPKTGSSGGDDHTITGWFRCSRCTGGGNPGITVPAKELADEKLGLASPSLVDAPTGWRGFGEWTGSLTTHHETPKQRQKKHMICSFYASSKPQFVHHHGRVSLAGDLQERVSLCYLTSSMSRLFSRTA